MKGEGRGVVPRWRVQALRSDDRGRTWIWWREFGDAVAALACWHSGVEGDYEQVDLLQDGRVVRSRHLDPATASWVEAERERGGRAATPSREPREEDSMDLRDVP